ncbi:hypothetical protein H2203_008725 [Taxawa tesnikishii (nom. ined.)]|nr:hypothetical protein H2203_008725 [Dothideales sp. JES 119]
MSAAQDEFNELFRDKDRRSRHPEDDNDSRSSSPARSPSPQNEVNDYDDDEGDNEDALARSAFAPSNARSNRTFLPSLKAHSNTGPKGVIADAHAFKDARHNHRISLSVSRTPVQEGFNELSLDDELDDDFMQSWRQSRLRELSGRGGSQSAQASEGQGGAAAARGQRRYGGLPRVDEEGFLEAVDGSGSHTVVVVFIYDDMSEVSELVEDCISTLARKYTATRFVKMHYQDAEMEVAGVPAVLAYKAGEKFAGLVPVVDEIPDDADLSPLTLGTLFQR